MIIVVNVYIMSMYYTEDIWYLGIGAGIKPNVSGAKQGGSKQENDRLGMGVEVLRAGVSCCTMGVRA